jgi:hypothetical protein
MSAPNAPVSLFRGSMSVQQGDRNHAVWDGELLLQWLPLECVHD